MPLDKVLSASIANAAVNASAISNTANLVIGALNTGNTVITGTTFANGVVTFANSTSNTVLFASNGSIGFNTGTITGGGSGAVGPMLNFFGSMPEIYSVTSNTTSGALQGAYGAITTGSGSTDKRGGIIVFENDGSNASTTNGRIKVWTNNGGSQYTRLWLSSNNNIGIGNVQSQPYSALHLFTSSAAPSWGEGITIEPSTSSYAAILFRLSNSGTGNTTGLWAIGKNANTETGGECFHIVKNSLTGSGAHRVDAAVQFKTTGNTVFGFSVTKPKQPAFLVSHTGFTKNNSWQKITGFAEDYDTLDNWDNTNSKFTAPEAGKYLFYAGGWSVSASSGERYAISAVVNGGSQTYISGSNYCLTDSPLTGYLITLNLAQNDYVELYGFSAVSTTWGGSTHRFYFGGYLLG